VTAAPIPAILRPVLETDRVLTCAQAQRHHGLDPARLPRGLYTTTRMTAPTKNTREVKVCYLAADPRLLHLDTASLRHLVLLAELRRALKVPANPSIWRSEADHHGLERPDGYWIPEPGASPVPLEIDVGGYSRDRVDNKLLHYHRNAPAQIWGSPSQSRLDFITERARAFKLPNVVTRLLQFP